MERFVKFISIFYHGAQNFADVVDFLNENRILSAGASRMTKLQICLDAILECKHGFVD